MNGKVHLALFLFESMISVPIIPTYHSDSTDPYTLLAYFRCLLDVVVFFHLVFLGFFLDWNEQLKPASLTLVTENQRPN